jgi:hypothetical protein
MIKRALGYYFAFSENSLCYISEKAQDFDRFFEEVLMPLNGNQLIVKKLDEVKLNIPVNEFQIWSAFITKIALHKKITFEKGKTSKKEKLDSSSEDENIKLISLRTEARNPASYTKPIVFLYIGESKIDSYTNDLMLLGFDDIEKKHPALENKKPRLFFSQKRTIARQKITDCLFYQIKKAHDETVCLYDPHLLNEKRFDILKNLVHHGIASSCKELIIYTSDIDLIQNDDVDSGISCGAFQARSLHRVRKLILNTFKNYCARTFKPKIFIYLCQVKIGKQKTFAKKQYTTSTKEWFHDRKFYIPKHIACVSTNSFLYPSDQTGEDCAVTYMDQAEIDDYAQKLNAHFDITPVCLHGHLRDDCLKCR